MMLKNLTFSVLTIAFVVFGLIAGETLGQKTSHRVTDDQLVTAPAAQVMAEEFNYPVGQLTTVSGGTWVTIGGTSNFIPVIAGSLTYPGYVSPGAGNKVQLTASTASSEDVYRSFTTQTTGTVYAAFLIKVLNTDLLPPNDSTTGDYFAGFISSASTSAFASRVTVRQGSAANTFQLGLRASGNTGNTQIFSSTNLNVGSTVLVVISYQIVAGDANDVTKMWINPTVGGAEPAADLTQVAAVDSADIGRFFLRQGSGNNLSTPNVEIDGINISTAWADLAGAATAPKDAPSDFNGDGKTDFSIVRPGPGGGPGTLSWHILHNGPNTLETDQFGFNSDFILPADYDGDGSDDIAVWRGLGANVGFWVLSSKTGTAYFAPFGQAGDDPVVVADYTNDGIDDMAIYRPDPVQGYFWIWPSSGPYKNSYAAVPWGNDRSATDADTALFGDYNGDGYADFTIYRTEGTRIRIWTLFGSADLLNQTFQTELFGGLSDLFVPGDYDGDGKTDLAVTRFLGTGAIRWLYKPSSGGSVVQINWGSAEDDLEAHGDYDGDGKTDLAVYRTSGTPMGYFIVRLSSGGVLYRQWGGVTATRTDGSVFVIDSPTIWEFK